MQPPPWEPQSMLSRLQAAVAASDVADIQAVLSEILRAPLANSLSSVASSGLGKAIKKLTKHADQLVSKQASSLESAWLASSLESAWLERMNAYLARAHEPKATAAALPRPSSELKKCIRLSGGTASNRKVAMIPLLSDDLLLRIVEVALREFEFMPQRRHPGKHCARGALALPLTSSGTLSALKRIRPELRLGLGWIGPSCLYKDVVSIEAGGIWRLVELVIGSDDLFRPTTVSRPRRPMLPSMPNLRSLMVPRCNLFVGKTLANTLAMNTQLERLDISHGRFLKEEGGWGATKHPQQRHAELDFCSVLSAALEANHTLRVLNLSGTFDPRRLCKSSGSWNGMAFDPEMASIVLKGVERNLGLRELYLNGNMVSVDDVCALLRANHTLTHLEMDGICDIDQYQKDRPFLRPTIEAPWQQKASDTLGQIAEALRTNNTLQSLSLRHNELDVTDSELSELNDERLRRALQSSDPENEEGSEEVREEDSARQL